jgi:hypothetical protein
MQYCNNIFVGKSMPLVLYCTIERILFQKLLSYKVLHKQNFTLKLMRYKLVTFPNVITYIQNHIRKAEIGISRKQPQCINNSGTEIPCSVDLDFGNMTT